MTRLEEIKAWQEARILCKMIKVLTRKKDFSQDFALVRQIRKSSGSAMDNIAEGFERDGSREFIQFLSIPKAYVADTRNHLYRAKDYEYITYEEFEEAKEQSILVAKLVAGLISYLRKSPLKGKKFNS